MGDVEVGRVDRWIRKQEDRGIAIYVLKDEEQCKREQFAGLGWMAGY